MWLGWSVNCEDMLPMFSGAPAVVVSVTVAIVYPHEYHSKY